MEKKPFLTEAMAQEIIQDVPTPFHVYDEKGIRENARRINKAFSWNKGFKEYFAVKALPNPVILQILQEEGCGVDCSSLTELMLSEACGFTGHEIMFSSNQTPVEDIQKAYELGAYINLDASGMAIWDLRIKNYPISLRYQVNLPFAGIMFSPNYGQSYYEIFTLGNWNGVINFTSLHNQPSLRQMLTVDFPVGRAKMRLAYLWDAQQSKVNDIKTHTYSHVLMVGFVKELFLIRDKKKK